MIYYITNGRSSLFNVLKGKNRSQAILSIMLKFFMLGVFLCYIPSVPSLPAYSEPKIYNTSSPAENRSTNIEDQLQRVAIESIPFFSANIIGPKSPRPIMLAASSVETMGKQLSSEYLVTKGIGAHKLHLRQTSWNNARKICIDEGGQLADVKSDSEQKIIQQLMVENSVEYAWVGYHDMFGEGDWVSVLGEPLGASGWARWWKEKSNPNNDGGKQNCAYLMKYGGGMNDDECTLANPFVCKIAVP